MMHPVVRALRIGHLRFQGCGVMTGRWLERNDVPRCQQEPPAARKRSAPAAVLCQAVYGLVMVCAGITG